MKLSVLHHSTLQVSHAPKLSTSEALRLSEGIGDERGVQRAWHG